MNKYTSSHDDESLFLHQVASLQIRNDLVKLPRYQSIIGQSFNCLSPNCKYIFYIETLWDIQKDSKIMIFSSSSLLVEPCFTQDSENLILIKYENQITKIFVFSIKKKQQILHTLAFTPQKILSNSYNYLLIRGESEFQVFSLNNQIKEISQIMQSKQKLFFTNSQNFLYFVEGHILRVITFNSLKIRKKLTLNNRISDSKISCIQNFVLIKCGQFIYIIDFTTQKKIKRIVVPKDNDLFMEKLASKNGSDFFIQLTDTTICLFITQLFPRFRLWPLKIIYRIRGVSDITISDQYILCASEKCGEISIYQW